MGKFKGQLVVVLKKCKLTSYFFCEQLTSYLLNN
jgi:hypothetical protein